MTDDQSAPEASEPAKEWWDDPGMPWKQKPTRADVVCLSMLGVVAVYSIVMRVLRPVILTLAPLVLGALGYLTGFVMTGALAAMGSPWWPLVLIVGSLMTIKFHWVYWWAGRRWGRDMLDTLAKDKSERTKARYSKLWGLAHRYETPALLATFLPLPLPAGLIYAALGAAGTTLKKFMIVCFVASFTSAALYMYLGYRIGEPAVRLVEQYSGWLWVYSIVLLIVVVGLTMWRSRRAPQA